MTQQGGERSPPKNFRGASPPEPPLLIDPQTVTYDQVPALSKHPQGSGNAARLRVQHGGRMKLKMTKEKSFDPFFSARPHSMGDNLCWHPCSIQPAHLSNNTKENTHV
jgi:hypothetical protein